MHCHQRRRSGEIYLIHPLEVAKILAQMNLDEVTIAAGLLHDVVEDTQANINDIYNMFGPTVAKLVNGVTKLTNIHFISYQKMQAENFRKMLLAMSQDIRVILIKLADRLHNMRTLEYMPNIKRIFISKETLDIYAPLANRLGICWLKSELEDLSFKYYKILNIKI